MLQSQLVMREEDFTKIQAVIQRLTRDANAKGIYIVDKAGQLIAEAGEMLGIDSTSLALPVDQAMCSAQPQRRTLQRGRQTTRRMRKLRQRLPIE